MIEVSWPNRDQTVQQYTDLEAGRYYLLKEGEAAVERPYQPVPLQKSDAEHTHGAG